VTTLGRTKVARREAAGLLSSRRIVIHPLHVQRGVVASPLMRIAACIKRVPDSETRVKIAADGKSLDEAGVKFILNPYDEFAVEEALRLKEKAGGGGGGVIGGGAAAAAEGSRPGLAMGARGVVRA